MKMVVGYGCGVFQGCFKPRALPDEVIVSERQIGLNITRSAMEA